MSYDVDIDVKSHTKKEVYGIRASIYNPDRKELQPHPSGVYIDCGMPVDPVTGLAPVDYEAAAELGFIKIDLLTNTAYDGFETKDDVLKAFQKEPNWDSLQDPQFVAKLPHIANHFELVELIKPRSIQELADLLALIRPGKTHLIDDYLEHPERTRKNLYRRPVNNQYWFKYSHAIAYAALIVTRMNYLAETDPSLTELVTF